MTYMESTCEVSKFLKFIDVKEEQQPNIWPIFVTSLEIKFDKSISVISLQLSNIK